MESSLEKFLYPFFNFKIFGKKVVIPYWSNKLKEKIYGPYGGKGTPEEIRQATIEAAKEANVDLEEMSGEEMHNFMKKNRIGLDCSGFAYQILQFLDYQKGGEGIENSIAGVKGTGIRKTNADALTNNINTLPVEDCSQVRIGDLIRLDGGRHVAVIIKADKQEIVYTHISSKAKIEGPHLGRIKIISSDKGLEEQRWEEEAKTGGNYGRVHFRPNLGDGLRRLKIWA